MSSLWHDLTPGLDSPNVVTAVVEIPSKSRNKYELDKVTGQLKLDRVLYSAVHYPGDYGFIPRTLAEDGDPADILIRLNESTFPGCVIDARPIGVLLIGGPVAIFLATLPIALGQELRALADVGDTVSAR